MRDLLFKEKNTYGDFLSSEEGISTNILANRLQRLEDHGIVAKHASKGGRNRVLYSLTEKGVDLLPILLEMISWSAKYDKKTEAPRKFVSELSENRDAVANQILRELKER